MDADLALIDGIVVTLAPDRPEAGGVAIANGHITTVGSTDEVTDEIGPDTGPD